MDAKEIRAVLNRAKCARLTAVESAIVMALLLKNDCREAERHTRRDLERETRYSKPGVNKALKSLYERGWVGETWAGCALNMEAASGIKKKKKRA